MAKTKAALLEEAKTLNLEVTTKNTIAEITAAIKAAGTTEAPSAEQRDEEAPKATTKAGKHSEKGVKEAEAKTEKIEAQKHREEEKAEEAAKPKQPQRVTTKLERRAKGYRKSV